ncbi:uncharacterized protein LOC124926229 [Impatiens glandulifera]|uniref:uncharacterized protein LOC124926229 n=1 Tax=Impatiens glandulifera TaxID=253017 RepID=UPI001FB067B0|nr:uncharacterized protein LOC124926229 [Impatiens glandulifera]
MTESFDFVDAQQLTDELRTMSLNPEAEVVKQSEGEGHQVNCEIHHGTCAICLNKIALQETALVKGCDHAYCVTCILRWATYKEKPTCPQCKHPFESLSVHRYLDGSIHDYMMEESVCLLVRASWFKPLIVEESNDEVDDYFHYVDDEEHDDLDEVYYNNRSSTNLRIGNRRWGDNGYVRAGRQEARPPPPVYLPKEDGGASGSSRQTKNRGGGAGKEPVGRRAKRTMKREAANRVASEKASEAFGQVRSQGQANNEKGSGQQGGV